MRRKRKARLVRKWFAPRDESLSWAESMPGTPMRMQAQFFQSGDDDTELHHFSQIIIKPGRVDDVRAFGKVRPNDGSRAARRDPGDDKAAIHQGGRGVGARERYCLTASKEVAEPCRTSIASPKWIHTAKDRAGCSTRGARSVRLTA